MRLPLRPTSKRGFNVVGIILLVMILAGAALVYSSLARQAGRGSHWFLDAQTAYDLADAGLKEAVFWLDHANNAGRAAAAPFMREGLSQAFDALATGADGTQVILVSHDEASTLTPSLRTQLERLSGASPKLTVVFRLESSQPLWSGSLQGIPANPKEKKSVVSIVATGSIQTPAGIRVERTITTSRGARVISILPPVVGRFALFVHPPAGQDTNAIARRYDNTNGDARPEGPAGSLVIKQPVAPPIVTAGTSQVVRPQFVNAIADPKFLDHQGWVFLGGTDAAPWKINLAHGYSDGGDSPLLPGDRNRHLFRGSAAEDDQFNRRFQTEFNSHPGVCVLNARPDTFNPRRGLYHLHHGTASNYEIIGLSSNVYREVQRGGARIKMEFGAVPASGLRLFGEPAALGPTVVFGPAQRTYFRRSSMIATMTPLECPARGEQLFNLYRIPEHSGRTQDTLRAAFQSDAGYADQGTNRVEEPYVESLNVVLDSRGAGAYGPDGVLYRLPETGGPAKTFSSDRLPALGTLPAAGGIPDAVLNQLVRGDMSVANLYTGNLHGALTALSAALTVKMAFTVKAEAFGTKVLVNKVLKVPGIAKVLGSALEITAVDKIENGGILIVDGPIRIRGDVLRGGTQEPLTLVSTTGGITVEGTVRTVEAQLVALGGKLTLPGGAFTVKGGIAARELDLPSLTSGTAPRTIEYTEELDPLGPNAEASLRVFYGNDPRVSVDGGGL